MPSELVKGFSTNSDTGTGLTRPVYWQRGAWAMIVKAGSSELALSGLLYGPEQTPAAADRMASAVIAEHTRVDWGSRLHLRQLKNVQQIQASDSAFAAILGDGSVVTWGNPEYGGDSSSVQDQLKNVRQIRASGGAFAAILSDGSIVTWGPASNGGDSSSMQDQLRFSQMHVLPLHYPLVCLCDGFAAVQGMPHRSAKSPDPECRPDNMCRSFQISTGKRNASLNRICMCGNPLRHEVTSISGFLVRVHRAGF